MKKFYIFLILIILQASYTLHSQWIQQTLPLSGLVDHMQFINHNIGWIVLISPINFIKTTDGGNNWTILSSGSNQVGKFQFFNDTLGYTIGIQGTTSIFSKTTDGGFNWTILYSSGVSFLDMYFVNKDTGWVVSGPVSNKNRILKTAEISKINF